MGQKYLENIKTKNKHLDTLKFINETEGEEKNNTDVMMTRRHKESMQSKEKESGDNGGLRAGKQISPFKAEVELRTIRPVKTIKMIKQTHPMALLKANSSVQQPQLDANETLRLSSF